MSVITKYTTLFLIIILQMATLVVNGAEFKNTQPPPSYQQCDAAVPPLQRQLSKKASLTISDMFAIADETPTTDTHTYDRIYGEIKLSYVSMQIIKHPLFQRLKEIKQLGSVAYHQDFAARHTRFEHSLGTAHLARHVMSKLQAKHPEITDREVICVEVAALCHDLGHGPFSHTFDKITESLYPKLPMAHHEARSQYLVGYIVNSIHADMKKSKKNKEHVDILTPMELALIQYFIDPVKYIKNYNTVVNEFGHPTDLPQFFYGIEQIVNNCKYYIDIDKMDYLIRDAHELHFDTVLSKNTIKVFDILDKSMIINNTWVFSENHYSVIHELLYRRSIFHRNGYSHPEVDAMALMIRDALELTNRVFDFCKCALLQDDTDVANFGMLTDDFIMHFIRNYNKDDRLREATDLITRVSLNRDLYQHVGDSSQSLIHNLNQETFCETKWGLHKNPSDPTHLATYKLPFHRNGMLIDPNGELYRLYSKT